MSNRLSGSNKQMMIHIASEITVVLCLTFYFNQKNKKLLAHIEDLAHRVEEQEDILQKHESLIRELVKQINLQSKTTIKEEPDVVIKEEPGVVIKEEPDVVIKEEPGIVIKEEPDVEEIEFSFAGDNPPVIVDELSDVTSEDLNTELADELKDLVGNLNVETEE